MGVSNRELLQLRFDLNNISSKSSDVYQIPMEFLSKNSSE